MDFKARLSNTLICVMSTFCRSLSKDEQNLMNMIVLSLAVRHCLKHARGAMSFVVQEFQLFCGEVSGCCSSLSSGAIPEGLPETTQLLVRG